MQSKLYIVYKSIASATSFYNNVYLGAAQREFKKWFHNHNSSFKSKSERNDTTLAKYLLDLKLKHSMTATSKWHILHSLARYSNITKCRLCFQEIFKIFSYRKPDELINKRSELVSKCRHMNKFLVANYKANDCHHTY